MKVSLQSAAAVLEHMDPNQFRALPVGITKEGRWLRYLGPHAALPGGGWGKSRALYPLHADAGPRPCPPFMAGRLRAGGRFRRSVPGTARQKRGRDGTIQGVFELAGVPVIGCGTLASALCMDKDRAHKLAALAGVAVPQSAVFSRGAALGDIRAAARRLAYPLFVKPVRAGSSFGVSRVECEEDLAAAVQAAFCHDSEILLEEAVPGFEVGCAVLGNEELTVGAVDEIELAQGFFDYTEKYTLKTSAIHCPARIPAQKAAEIQAAARTVYKALGCRVFARVDLFLTPDGRILLNEVNTIPGFTAHSRYPSMMKSAGLKLPALITRMIELGVAAQ